MCSETEVLFKPPVMVVLKEIGSSNASYLMNWSVKLEVDASRLAIAFSTVSFAS